MKKLILCSLFATLLGASTALAQPVPPALRAELTHLVRVHRALTAAGAPAAQRHAVARRINRLRVQIRTIANTP